MTRGVQAGEIATIPRDLQAESGRDFADLSPDGHPGNPANTNGGPWGIGTRRAHPIGAWALALACAAALGRRAA